MAELTSGARLGAYEIAGLLGSGGMGRVYRARDTRLGRDVAIKVLPSAFTADPERRARFDREARLLAAFNHPHICTLYDVGEHEGAAYLVMEHLEGETLADRLQTGPLPQDQAIQYAMQIVDALDKAHRAGITHRDLKPANVMLTKSGAKLLDFGLAKVRDVGPASTIGGVSMFPTEEGITAQGAVLGTLQYMAPEQLEGAGADARTDVFACGAVLYEMLTGRKAFEGKSQASLIAAILQLDPRPLATVRPLTPPGLVRIVETCLAKDPDDRWQTMRDLLRELRWSATAGNQSEPAMPSSGVGSNRRQTRVLGVVGLVTAAAVTGLVVWFLTRGAQAPSPEISRVLIGVAPADELTPQPTRTAMAFSPDGRSIVFSAAKGGRQQLYVRALDRLEAVPLAGTEGSNSPFFSPDGQWIGFWSGQLTPGAIGELKKVPLAGGPAITLCRTAPLFGASWGSADFIVFANGGGGLWRVSAVGGAPQPLTTLDEKAGERSHRLPHVLPTGELVLFTILKAGGRPDDGQVAVRSLVTQEQKILIDRAADARYLPSGHLMYARDGVLLAVPFNVKRLELTGVPTGVVDGVVQAVNTGFLSLNDTGAAQFSVSDSGSLAYLPGGIFQDTPRTLVWVDRSGVTTPVAVTPRPYLSPRFSPDGEKLVMNTTGTSTNVWIYDFMRETMTNLTPEGLNFWPTWTPDGKRVMFATSSGIVSLSPNGGEAEPLLGRGSVPVVGQPGSWSPDGKNLAFIKQSSTTNRDIWIFSRESGEHRLRPLRQRPALERYPQFSPDGRWLAYASDESGRDEVYVEPYPGTGERQQVSTDGGSEVAWARNGRELFYTSNTDPTVTKMLAVDVSLDPTFKAGKPRVLFEGQFQAGTPLRNFDVAPDGRRFLMTRNIERPRAPLTQMIVVLNWFAELQQRVPTR